MNELGLLIRSLGTRLQQRSGPEAALAEVATNARDHGKQRLEIGWDIADLARDYEILHEVTLAYLEEVFGDRIRYGQARIIAKAFSRATEAAIEAFSTMAQERQAETNRKLDEQLVQQQDELRRLTLALTDAEHRQRRRMASVLHDDLQQTVMAVRLKLRAAMGEAPPSSRAQLEEADDLLTQVFQVTRNLTADLNTLVVERDGLVPAIEWLATSFRERYGLSVAVDLGLDRRSDPGPMALRRLVFDSVRELLFNVVKHAQTKEAWVKVQSQGRSSWLIEVGDPGVGMDQPREGAADGFGLATLRHRIERLGGAVEVCSSTGQGTRVVMTVPVDLP